MLGKPPARSRSRHGHEEWHDEGDRPGQVRLRGYVACGRDRAAERRRRRSADSSQQCRDGPGTWHAMTGLPYLGRLYFGLRKPRRPVPGLDVAGTIAAIGAEVTGFAVGDEVFGIGKGSFAEYTAAREDRLVPKPANL